MPKYKYKCSTCGLIIEQFAGVSVKTIDCPKCSLSMNRQLPNLGGYKATETIDKYSNKKHVTDQSSLTEERKLDYYWKHEVPKMVDSGVYVLETMLEQGWVYYNEKKELVTRTKPPSKE